MATTTIPWLARQLRNIGLSVIETPGWESRGRPLSTGEFQPYGVLIHHTGARSSGTNPAPSKNYVISGSSKLPGPLCHVLIDHHGRCHAIAAGRANHAGQAVAVSPMPAGDGNRIYVGIEIDYFGPAREGASDQKMTDNQYLAAVAASAAIMHRFGLGAERVKAHFEIAPGRKIDPYGISMTTFRQRVAAKLRGAPPGAV